MLLSVLSWLCSSSLLLLLSVSGGKLPEAEVKIEVLHRPFLCHRKSKYGDILLVHQEGYFENGTMFHTRYEFQTKKFFYFPPAGASYYYYIILVIIFHCLCLVEAVFCIQTAYSHFRVRFFILFFMLVHVFNLPASTYESHVIKHFKGPVCEMK